MAKVVPHSRVPHPCPRSQPPGPGSNHREDRISFAVGFRQPPGRQDLICRWLQPTTGKTGSHLPLASASHREDRRSFAVGFRQPPGRQDLICRWLQPTDTKRKKPTRALAPAHYFELSKPRTHQTPMTGFLTHRGMIIVTGAISPNSQKPIANSSPVKNTRSDNQ